MRGNRPSGLALIGVIVAISSLLLVMYSPSLRGALRRGIGLSLMASALFGVSFVLVGGTSRTCWSLATVAVSASMFPAASATLAAAFDEDTLRWWQMIGVLGVVTGIALMALS